MKCATEVRRTTLGRYLPWCITHAQALADPQRRPEQAEQICVAHKVPVQAGAQATREGWVVQ